MSKCVLRRSVGSTPHLVEQLNEAKAQSNERSGKDSTDGRMTRQRCRESGRPGNRDEADNGKSSRNAGFAIQFDIRGSRAVANRKAGNQTERAGCETVIGEAAHS